MNLAWARHITEGRTDLMLLPFRKEDAYAKDISKASNKLRWFGEIVRLLNQHLSQGLGADWDDGFGIEDVKISKKAMIRNLVLPSPKALAIWLFHQH